MKTKNKVVLITTSVVLLLAMLGGLLYLFLGYLPQKRKQEELQRMMENYYNEKVAGYELENANYLSGEVDVVFLGDSLTDGYNLKTYYPQYTTLNRGIGGDTTFGLEDRLKVSVYDVQPKVAVMLIGANNLNTMFNNYENILVGLKQNLPNTQVVILSLTAMGGSWAKDGRNQTVAFNNAKIKSLASKYEFNFVDLFSALLNTETNEIFEEYTTDGGHLTEKGYDIVTNQVTPMLLSLIGY